jgi:5'-nucleotidase
VLHGLPGLAFSQDLSVEVYTDLKDRGGQPDDTLRATLKISAIHAARLVGELVAATPPASFIAHNINFPYPCRPDSDCRRTVPARMIIPGLFGPAQDDGTHRFVFHLGQDLSPAEPLTDHAALARGFISHTILDYKLLGRTDAHCRSELPPSLKLRRTGARDPSSEGPAKEDSDA